MMGLTRRDVMILFAIWGAVAALLVVALFTLWKAARSTPLTVAGEAAAPTPLPTYTPVAVEQTARHMYTVAEMAARGWRPDAQLVSCRGSWEQTAVNLIGRPIEWIYRFYSPQWRRLYFVRVEPGGEVHTIQHIPPVTQPPLPLPLEDWRVDSSAALASWLNAGGGHFLGAHPGSTVTAQLNMRVQDLQPLWTVAGYADREDAFFVTTVDARTGETTVLAQP
ncbi:MAG: hypothetical protein NZ765_04645 [Anaerolineae bacterium]|nr:hypothetical protein [Anaerolineae bacterium]MDW8070242.1 hypothetical protein [Anaerolineae bacterium]